ncbi:MULTISPECIES: VOC family protein [Microbacterium]|uniref:VOC family protein n=1 Tax=Microbacterium TaxID=33882 RepID=UPI00217EFD1B|nr:MULTISPECIES: VOC family protein [Microbacterium]UWF77651.1 VOC family protein [Microbacterium neungamense]WCM55820.1 VOC family protein [Microbacterium sp. EF45047]
MDAVSLGPIGQISRSVDDIAAAEAWYRDVLGLRHLYTFGTLSFFECDGTRLFLSQGDGPVHEESILYFRVPDIERARADLGERGVVFTHEPQLIHTHEDGCQEWMAFFTDLEGRPLALMEQRRPE